MGTAFFILLLMVSCDPESVGKICAQVVYGYNKEFNHPNDTKDGERQ
jgi:hypothetical protein